MKIRKCSIQNCYNKCEPGSYYCLKHQSYQIERDTKEAIRLNNLPKSTLYQTPQWRELVKLIIQEQECCAYCGSQINLQVHHIKKHYNNPALFFDKNNLILVCSKCHNKISMKQVRGYRGTT